jgi:hypothetical protein
MAVISTDGLLITNESGKQLTTVKDSFKIIRWLPDSTHALAVTNEVAASWKELQPKLTTQRKQEIILFAKNMWKRGSVPSDSLDTQIKTEAGLYLTTLYGMNIVDSKLKKLELKKCPCILLHALRTLDLPTSGQAHEGSVIWRTDQEIQDVRISPTGSIAALTLPLPNFLDEQKILVVPIKGAPPKIVALSHAGFSDWTPDGKSLFFISHPIMNIPQVSKLNSSEPMYAATLNRIEIADGTGNLLSKFASPKVIAKTLDGEIYVHCLPDGSVIFNSKQRTFPTTKVDDKSDKKWSLFRLKPDMKSIEVLVDQDNVDDVDFDLLEPNQAGTKISLAESSNGSVSYLDIATGKVTVLEKGESKDIKFAPQWRNDDELCYPARNLNKGTGEHDADVILQSTTDFDQRAILSKDWSAKSVEFLNDQKETENESAKSKKQPVRNSKKHVTKQS